MAAIRIRNSCLTATGFPIGEMRAGQESGPAVRKAAFHLQPGSKMAWMPALWMALGQVPGTAALHARHTHSAGKLSHSLGTYLSNSYQVPGTTQRTSEKENAYILSPRVRKDGLLRPIKNTSDARSWENLEIQSTDQEQLDVGERRKKHRKATVYQPAQKCHRS